MTNAKETNERESIAAKLRTLGIRPPVVAAACVVVSFVLNLLIPAPLIISPWRLYAGLVLFVTGLALGIVSLRIFHKHGTTHDPFGEPTVLAKSGPYRVSRNPMYVGVTLTLLGIAVSRGTAAWFLAPPAFVLIINFYFIPGEEKLLEDLFGGEYVAYKKHVRRWI